MPAEIDTEERILYFSLEMLLLYGARNLKKLSLLILPLAPFLLSDGPLSGVNFADSLLFQGPRIYGKLRGDGKQAPRGKCRRGRKRDVCSDGDS